ncbi:MAG: M56 family metallopeptidase [Saprospiraceae bacterium]
MVFSLHQQDLLHAWIWALMHSIWIGLVLAFIYYSYLNIFHSASARTKYNIGMALFLLIPVGCMIAFGISLRNQMNTQALGLSAIHPGTLVYVNNSSSFNTATSGTSLGQSITPYIPSIFFVWCIGVLLLSLRMIIGYREINLLRKQSTIIQDNELKSLFDKLIQASEIKKVILFASSAKIEMPITLGHIRPIILLPVSLINQLNPQETYAILAHELAHILRKDYLQNLIISMSEILFFFHPSVWWFASTIKSIREQCCDDIALRLGAERMALSKALVTLEDQNRAPLFAMAFSHKNQLLHRIQRLFETRTTNEFTMSRGQAPILICSLAILWLLGSAFHPASEILSRASNFMPLAKSFLWDPTMSSDTTKPKVKIEKITKDNGKQKVELSLEDKKIKELKVDDKIIAPREYEKYKAETEALTKELKEIEMPESKARARTYMDYERTPGSYSYSYDFDDDGDDQKIKAEKESKNKKSYSYSYSPNIDVRPRVYAWSGDEPIRIRNKIQGIPFGSDGHIKYIIEGDSSGMTIDGDKLILKNDKGDVIIDFNNGRGLGWSGTPRAFYFSPDVIDMKEFKEKFKNQDYMKEFKEKFKNLDEMKELKQKFEEDGLLREKWNDELKLNLDQNHKLLDEQLFKQKQLLDGQHLKLLKEGEWRDRKLFKDREGFNLWSGKGKLDQIIQEHLVDDQIIKDGEKYEFSINEREMKVNGKKQDQKTYAEYKELIEDATGIEMKANTNFQFSGSGKKD